MATSQQFLVCDSSTLANFKAWAQAISSFFTTAGWTQSTDTGQVNWSSIASVPGSAAYVYEIWQPSDGLTTFFLKVEYGNLSGTNSPNCRLTLSSAMNGSGTPTGTIIGPFSCNGTVTAPVSTTATYECNLFGTSGSIAIMMWRTSAIGVSVAGPIMFCVERSVNSSGSAISSYVTLWTLGSSSTALALNQQSLVYGIGTSPILINPSCVRGNNLTTAGAFNGSIPFDLCSPYVGYWDQNCTVLGSGAAGDFTEGVTFNATVYGSTRTYMPTKITTALSKFGPGLIANSYVICVRTA